MVGGDRRSPPRHRSKGGGSRGKHGGGDGGSCSGEVIGNKVRGGGEQDGGLVDSSAGQNLVFGFTSTEFTALRPNKGLAAASAKAAGSRVKAIAAAMEVYDAGDQGTLAVAGGVLQFVPPVRPNSTGLGLTEQGGGATSGGVATGEGCDVAGYHRRSLQEEQDTPLMEADEAMGGCDEARSSPQFAYGNAAPPFTGNAEAFQGCNMGPSGGVRPAAEFVPSKGPPFNA